ncbi:hypothetical protein ABZP36_007180 [Zizania latifolia]
MDVQQKIIREMTRMKDENNRLRIIMRQYMGDDLASLTLQDVSNLEQQVEFSLYKVRLRKQQLLDQHLLEMNHREMHIPGEQNNYLCHMNLLAREQSQAAAMADPKPFPLWDVGKQMYSQDGESSMTALQLSPRLHEYKLQPLQPNLQEADLHG